TTRRFDSLTTGFAAPEDANMAVCVLPGTELAFAAKVSCQPRRLFTWKTDAVNHTTAIFRQINKDARYAHRDALEFPDGQIVLLNYLCEGQKEQSRCPESMSSLDRERRMLSICRFHMSDRTDRNEAFLQPTDYVLLDHFVSPQEERVGKAETNCI